MHSVLECRRRECTGAAGAVVISGGGVIVTVTGKVLFYVKIHVKLPQVFTILREYSRNVHSAKFHI